ncbi:MAG: ECF transporter S component [Oscillospiraceae bacterium]|nr:ECF transporter S component [Oscillospiraceae bacterium]
MEKKRGFIAPTDIVQVGVFAAIVYGGMWLRIQIPAPVGFTAVNLGNIFVLMAGLMLGPVKGGLAAGIGGMVFNLTHPILIAYWPFTLVFRFAHAFVCGLVSARGGKMARMTAAAAAGQLTYITLYLSQVFFWDGVVVKGLYPAEAWISLATPAVTTLINGVIAVTVAAPLTLALQKALGRRRT